MNLLILEDESRVAGALADALTEIADADGWPLAVRIAANRDEAVEVLLDDEFTLDLAILDLQVPASAAPTPADRVYGLEVFEAIRRESYGTKMVVFSGRADGAAMTQIVDAARTSDPLGLDVQESMIEFVDKEDLDACVTRVARYGRELAALDVIEISFGTERFDLSPLEKRIVQIVGRRLAARRIHIGLLKGGFSGSRTLRLQLYRRGVQPFASLVAKIGDLAEVEEEHRAYNAHVAPRLSPGAFPQYADRIDAGAGSLGAILFRLADAYSSNGLELLRRGGDPRELVSLIQQKTAEWHEARAVRSMAVRDIRRILLPDARLGEVERWLSALPWRAVEDITLDVHACSQHGDLHLLNVLTDNSSDLVLIDFARAGEAPASLDPLALELGLTFHPGIRSDPDAWPSPTQISDWWNLGSYLTDCPFPEFVRACRGWAHEVAAGDGEVAAVVYSFGMRQLRWDSAATLAVPLVEVAIRELV